MICGSLFRLNASLNGTCAQLLNVWRHDTYTSLYTHTNNHICLAMHIFRHLFIYLLPLVCYLWINFHCYYGKTTIRKQRCVKPQNSINSVKLALNVPTSAVRCPSHVSFQIWKLYYFNRCFFFLSVFFEISH